MDLVTSNSINGDIEKATVWTLEQILEVMECERPTLESPIFTAVRCEQFVTVLIHHGMKDVPLVAQKACNGITLLAQSYFFAGYLSTLDPYLEKIAGSLVVYAERPDVCDSQLQIAAYQALREVARCATKATAPVLWVLLSFNLRKLQGTLEAKKQENQSKAYEEESQGALLGCLQVIVQKLGRSKCTMYSFQRSVDRIMGVLLRVLDCTTNVTVKKEAITVFGFLAKVGGTDFSEFMPQLANCLKMVLQSHQELELYPVGLSVLVDCCSTLEGGNVRYCDGFMRQLIDMLSGSHLHRILRPASFSCIGELAAIMCGNFYKYLEGVMRMLHEEAQLCLEGSFFDPEVTYQFNLLRHGILEAYSGIFRGFRSSPTPLILKPFVPQVFQFLSRICHKGMNARVMRVSIQVLRDVAATLRHETGPLILQHLSVKAFLEDCLISEDPLVKGTAKRAERAIGNRSVAFESELLRNKFDLELPLILLNAQATDGATRKPAEESLIQFLKQKDSYFLLSVCKVLSEDHQPVASRKLAGLVLKNAFLVEKEYEFLSIDRWDSLDKPVKSQIEKLLLQTLSSPVLDARSSASQVIANIVRKELCHRHRGWASMVGSLLADFHQLQFHAKQAAFQAFGYAFEDVDRYIENSDVAAEIVTAILQIMSASEENNEIRISAAQTLCRALSSEKNIIKHVEFSHIIRAVIDATSSLEKKIRLASFESLATSPPKYYKKLAPYIEEIVTVTTRAMRDDEDCVAILAIEFWRSLCDIELHLTKPCIQLVKRAVTVLVPVLLEKLLKQDYPYEIKNACTPTAAAVTCIKLVAQTVGDDIVQIVMHFFQENIVKIDCRPKEAALCAFGSIVLGPTYNTLTLATNDALVIVINALQNNPSDNVRRSAAWALRRFIKFIPTTEPLVLTNSNGPHIIKVLLHGLKDVPRIAEMACRALYFIAEHCVCTGIPSSFIPLLDEIIISLLAACQREVFKQIHIKIAAYEAFIQVVRCASGPSTVLVEAMPLLLEEAQHTLEEKKLPCAGELQEDLLGVLCRGLLVIIEKLGTSQHESSGFRLHFDHIMAVFVRVFRCTPTTVQKDIMSAISSFVHVAGSDFARYMPQFYICLEMCLQNLEQRELYLAAVGVMVEVCRSLKGEILPYCDGIMNKLHKDLSTSHLDDSIFYSNCVSENKLHWSMISPIFTCVGEVAAAIHDNFDKYLEDTMAILQINAKYIFGGSFYSLKHRSVALRCGILEAYSLIFQCFKNSPKIHLLLPYASDILELIGNFKRDERDEEVMEAAFHACGVVAETLGRNPSSLILQYISSNPSLNDLIQRDLLTDFMLKRPDWAI